MITSKCVCGMIGFGMCVGFVCVCVCEGVSGAVCECILLSILWKEYCFSKNLNIQNPKPAFGLQSLDCFVENYVIYMWRVFVF